MSSSDFTDPNQLFGNPFLATFMLAFCYFFQCWILLTLKVVIFYQRLAYSIRQSQLPCGNTNIYTKAPSVLKGSIFLTRAVLGFVLALITSENINLEWKPPSSSSSIQWVSFLVFGRRFGNECWRSCDGFVNVGKVLIEELFVRFSTFSSLRDSCCPLHDTQLPDGRVIKVGSERFQAPEALFSPVTFHFRCDKSTCQLLWCACPLQYDVYSCNSFLLSFPLLKAIYLLYCVVWCHEWLMFLCGPFGRPHHKTSRLSTMHVGLFSSENIRGEEANP